MNFKIKKTVDYLLCKKPEIYISILQFLGSKNLEKQVYLTLVDSSDRVFDIGANQGYYTSLFSNLAGKSGQIHTFEPIPSTFHRLSEMVEGANYKNIRLSNYVVSDICQQVSMKMPGGDSGQASLREHYSGSWQASETVIHQYTCQSTTIDTYIEELESQGWERERSHRSIDFLKCDVEGAELLVLKGASRILTRDLPVIFLEICHDWTKDYGYQPVDIVIFLEGLGYDRFYLVDKSIRPLILKEHDLSATSLTESSNLLCFNLDAHCRKIQRFETLI